MIDQMNTESGMVVNDNVKKELFAEKTKFIRDEYVQANGDHFIKLIEEARQ